MDECKPLPPAPWQHGMAPTKHPIRFMTPTLVATGAGFAGRSGNRSADSQGLTLAHILTQPETFLSLKPAKHPTTWDKHGQTVLTLGRSGRV